MAFTGDVLLHNRVMAKAAKAAEAATVGEGRAHDFRPLLEPIRPLVEGVDWAVCHMEINLSADGTRLASYPRFRGPGQVASDLRDLGYDACSTASNHTLDHGVDGVIETLGVLDGAGLRATGSARSQAEAAEQIWYEIGGVRVAHLSYTYGFNGFVVPAEALWTSNPIDEQQILAAAAAARSKGAEYIVLSMHWGDQYVHAPSAQQQEIGPRLLASPDIDLIIGHHVHVVQPIENLDGEWLVYGLGNQLANQVEPARRDELLVRVSVSEEDDGGFRTALEVVPLVVDPATLVVHPSDPARRPPGTPAGLAAEMDASRQRVVAVLEAGSGWGSFAFG